MGSELKRKLDYSDLQVTPDDGKRYELAEGELLVTPSPGTRHQRASGELFLQLAAYFPGRGAGWVYAAPTDLILGPHDVFVPDLLVVANPGHVSERGIEGPPLLVVEILSPATRRVDLTTKPRRYAELGVPHYWIVDPDAARMQCYALRAGAFELVCEAADDATLAHPGWDGLTIDLAPLWRTPGATP